MQPYPEARLAGAFGCGVRVTQQFRSKFTVTSFIFEWRIYLSGALPHHHHLSNYYIQQHHNNNILQQSKEANIILAIEAIRYNPQISIQATTKTFRAPETTLRSRL